MHKETAFLRIGICKANEKKRASQLFQIYNKKAIEIIWIYNENVVPLWCLKIKDV